MKHLIITGDDFGASPQVNEEIERLHRAGVLTQAGLMVNGPAAGEAVRIAQRNPSLCVGLHLVLCERSPARNGLRFFLDRRMRRPLEETIEEQFARFIGLGFDPVCWDGHMHLHLHPTVFDIALPIAGRHGFRAARIVNQRRTLHPLALVFRVLSTRAERRLSHCVDRTVGLTKTGRMNTNAAVAAVRALEDGWSELYFHPGTPGEYWDASHMMDAIKESGAALRSARDLIAGSVS
jgi:predicted glycoside hydrolase/deacetylase ChbG (UPF0249 family)